MKKIAALMTAVLVLALAASAPAVVINEFMYSTEGGNAFIELYNRSGAPVDVSGWKLRTSNAAANDWSAAFYTVPAATTLAVGEFYLIASQDVFVTVPDVEQPFTLPNPIGTPNKCVGVQLTDGTDPIDTVLYGDGAVAASGNIVDDAGSQAAADQVDVENVQIGGGAAKDLSVSKGFSLRRSLDGGPKGSDGNGWDTNTSSNDFVAAIGGDASPKNRAGTPVTLSVFEIE